MHNAFRKGVTSLKLNVDQFALDIHFFFKLSAARKADYRNLTNVTNVVAEHALKHSTTSWITLRRVLVRLVEQYDNLKHYFLLCQQHPSNRLLKKPPATSEYAVPWKMMQYLSFVAYFATDFELFVRKFHSMNSLVHVLYDEMERSLLNILPKFIKSKYLGEEKMV